MLTITAGILIAGVIITILYNGALIMAEGKQFEKGLAMTCLGVVITVLVFVLR